MGLIANYSCLSDVNLKELKAMGSEEEKILESVEEWNDDDELLLDIDKMWDVLHFVLTGVGTDHKDDKNPLSQAVLGVMAVEDISDYVAYTEHNHLANIVAALDQFDIESALESFDMTACKEAELYPNIWDYDEEEEEIKDEILHDFEQMKVFYKKVLEARASLIRHSPRHQSAGPHPGSTRLSRRQVENVRTASRPHRVPRPRQGCFFPFPATANNSQDAYPPALTGSHDSARSFYALPVAGTANND